MPWKIFSTPALISCVAFVSSLMTPFAMVAQTTPAASQVNSIVTLDASRLPTASNRTLQLTATVAPSIADGYRPTGTVTFWDGVHSLGTREVSYATGQAVYETTNPPLSFKGTNLTATYGGDAHLFPNGAAPIHLTSKGSLLPESAISLDITPSLEVAPGTVVTLSAHVSDGGSLVTPGVVLFYDHLPTNGRETLLGQAQLTEGGVATLRLRLGAGAHNIRAAFQGTNVARRSSSVPQTVTVTGTPIASGPGTTYSLTQVPGPFVDFAVAALVDFNGDGILDALLVPSEDSVIVLFGNPDGTFSDQKPTVLGDNTHSILKTLVGDFNSDGKPDLALLEGNPDDGNDTVSILLGNGDGYFTRGQSFVVSDYFAVGAFVSGDFNGDGIPDFAVTYNSSGKGHYSIYLGRGDGRVETAKTGSLPAQAEGGAVVGDFNSDGTQDIAAVVDNGKAPISLLLGNGDGTFVSKTLPSPCAEPALQYAGYLNYADFNGDGTTDLVPAFCGTNVMLGNGDGSFRLLQVPPPSGEVVDVNNDGVPDIVNISGAFGELYVHLGVGDGTFAPSLINEELPFPSEFGYGAVGDLNGDGIPDVISSTQVDGPECFCSGPPQTSLVVYFGVTAAPAAVTTLSTTAALGAHP